MGLLWCVASSLPNCLASLISVSIGIGWVGLNSVVVEIIRVCSYLCGPSHWYVTFVTLVMVWGPIDIKTFNAIHGPGGAFVRVLEGVHTILMVPGDWHCSHGFHHPTCALIVWDLCMCVGA